MGLNPTHLMTILSERALINQNSLDMMRNNQHNMHIHQGVSSCKAGGGGWFASDQEGRRRDEFHHHHNRWEQETQRSNISHYSQSETTWGSIHNRIDGRGYMVSNPHQAEESSYAHSDYPQQQTNSKVAANKSTCMSTNNVQDTELVDGVPNKNINRSVTVDDTTATQGDDAVARTVENEKDTDADAEMKDAEVKDPEMELEEELFRQIERSTSLNAVAVAGTRKNGSEAATTSGYVLGDDSQQPLLQTVALKNLTNSFGQLSDNGQLPQSNSNTPSNKRRMSEEYYKQDGRKKKTKHAGEGEYQRDTSV